MNRQKQWLFEVPSILEAYLSGGDAMADSPNGKGGKSKGIDRATLGKRVMNLRSQVLAARKQAGAQQNNCRDQINRFDVAWRRVMASLQRSNVPAFTLARQVMDLESRTAELLACLGFSNSSSEINPEFENQWLFEAPFVLRSDRYTNPYPNLEYYNNSESGGQGGVFIPCELTDAGLKRYKGSSDSVTYKVSFHVEFKSFYREVERVISTSIPSPPFGFSVPIPQAIVRERLKYWTDNLRQVHQKRIDQQVRTGNSTFISLELFYYFVGKGGNRRKCICDFKVIRLDK